jgi:hypothetical protein
MLSSITLGHSLFDGSNERSIEQTAVLFPQIPNQLRQLAECTLLALAALMRQDAMQCNATYKGRRQSSIVVPAPSACDAQSSIGHVAVAQSVQVTTKVSKGQNPDGWQQYHCSHCEDEASVITLALLWHPQCPHP